MADAPIRDLFSAVQSSLGGAQPPVSTNLSAAQNEQDRLARRKMLTPIPMTADECGLLWKDIEKAKERFRKRAEVWKILLKEYVPNVQESGQAEAVKVNAHFYNSETKIGQLFPRAPRVDCIPKGPAKDLVLQPGQPVPQTAIDAGAVAIKQSVLNDYLGPDRINSSLLMRLCLFDILCWSGFGCIKVGFSATMIDVQTQGQMPDPNFQSPETLPGLNPAQQPPMVPAVDAAGQPVMQTTQQSIYEEIYGKHFSPLKFLCNEDCTSPDLDRDARWVGWMFAIDKNTAKRQFALSDAEMTKTGSDENIFRPANEDKNTTDDLVLGVELWRKASLVRADSQPHPLAIDHVVLIEGLKEYPVVNRPSPDQTFGPDGRLTEDSLIGFPLCVIQNRVMGDSAFIYADNAFTNGQVKELNTYLRQGVELREASIPIRVYDVAHFDEADKDALRHPEPKRLIAVKQGTLAQAGGARGIIDTVAQPTNTVDTYRGEQRIQQSMERTLGISGPQLSTPTDTVHSATEIAEASTSFAGRMGTEQDFVVAGYIAFARKVDALIMRYGPKTPEYTYITGTDGAKTLAVWNRALVCGRYSYDIVTDSTWRLDAAQQVRLNLSIYNVFKGDPLFNRAPFMRKIIQFSGEDPSQCVMTPAQIAQQAMAGTPQPPHAQPEPNEAEMNRTGATPNGPESPNGPSRIIQGGKAAGA